MTPNTEPTAKRYNHEDHVECRKRCAILARRVVILEQLFEMADFGRVEPKDKPRLGLLLLLEPYTADDVRANLGAHEHVKDVLRSIK